MDMSETGVRSPSAASAPNTPGTLHTLRTRAKDLLSRAKELLSALRGRQACALLLGFCYARAVFPGGCAPFGPAYVAASAQPVWAAVGVMLGALGQADGIPGIACAVIVCACRAVFRDTDALRRGWLMPLCAGVTLCFVRSVTALGGGIGAWLLLLCGGLLCAGAACLFAQARHPAAAWCPHGRMTAVCVVLIALARLTPLGGFSPARALGLLSVLLIACDVGPTAGAALGTALGAAFDLLAGGGLCASAVFCFAGLSCGLCALRRPTVGAFVGIVSCGAAALWLRDIPAAAALWAESCAAAGLLLLTPQRLHRALAADFSRRPGRTSAADGRRGALAAALRGLSDSLADLWDEPPAADPAEVLRMTADRLCRSCPARARCWIGEYQSTMAALTPLLPLLREQGALDPDRLPPSVTARCLHPRRLCGALNENYRALLRRQASAARDEQARQALRAQCAGLEQALRGNEPRESHAALERRVRRIVRAYVPRAHAVVWSAEGRLFIDLSAPDGLSVLPDSDALLRSLEQALGRAFLPPTALETDRGSGLRIAQRELLRLTLCGSARPRDGEQVSGDATMQLHTPDGRAVLMLADGMGSGPEAAASARSALELLAGFARAGCSLADSAAAVLPALCARMERRGFVTLDLLEVHLFSGRAQWLKYGAAAGFLIRDGRVRPVSSSALPAGLDPDAAPCPTVLYLLPGDLLVLLSDGITERLDAAEFLRSRLTLPPAALSAALVEEAARGGTHDDLTALIAQIRPAAE